VRTPVARAGIAVLTVAALAGLFLLASGSGDGSGSAVDQPPVAQGAAGGPSPAPRSTARKSPRKRAARPPAPVVARIVIRGGKPVGGVKRLEYKRGERVRFSVRSDLADAVHVHGFDIEKPVPANRPVRFAFPADIEGVFEVELHSGHTKIAELRVRP
jgi:hypothetical protein